MGDSKDFMRRVIWHNDDPCINYGLTYHNPKIFELVWNYAILDRKEMHSNKIFDFGGMYFVGVD